jgi:hypothetical protein
MVYLVGIVLYYSLRMDEQDFNFKEFLAGFLPKKVPS